MKTLAILMLLVQQQPPEAPKDEQAELKEHWTKILEMCRQEKKDELQKAIAAMEMTQEEMAALFGEEKAKKAYPRYAETWKDVLAEAAADLIARCKKGEWDTVDVLDIRSLKEEELSDADRGVLASLASKDTKVFNVRLKQKDQQAGYVLRCFIKTKAGWRMGLKIGTALAEK